MVVLFYVIQQFLAWQLHIMERRKGRNWHTNPAHKTGTQTIVGQRVNEF